MNRFTKHAKVLITGTGLAFVVASILLAIVRWFQPAVFSLEATMLTLFLGAALAILPLLQRNHD